MEWLCWSLIRWRRWTWLSRVPCFSGLWSMWMRHAVWTYFCIPFDDSVMKKACVLMDLFRCMHECLGACVFVYPCACASVFCVAVCACVLACLLTRMFISYARMHVIVCNFCCVSAHRLGRLHVCILVWLSFSRQCVCMLRWLCGWMRVCSCERSSACCFVWL